ncbi:IPTL-CTERM sorting domain-containing protein [Brevundimonas sp.]|uniref:IPTL-CTERM sorting domain-containing protein n=1 Tax=Brevundimonas sp. TaxID=1871086 RepID=UPI002FDB7420
MRWINYIAGGLAATALALCGVGAASAQIVVSNTAYAGTQSIEDVLSQHGQIVVAPGNQLNQYTLEISRAPASPTLTVVPKVYTYNAGVVGAVPIWTGAPVNVPSTVASTFTFSPGIPVTIGNSYVLAVDQQSSGELGRLNVGAPGNYLPADKVHYSLGSWSLSGLNQDLVFTATFAAPVSVPTLSEWAMILMALALAGGAAFVIQRRRLAG